ncbi:cilium assembly protein DZIP1-like [Stegostoma tigrinum]|uniref:cilium assembly protein DZIP1-like n=1 Tax=Stegostoma tigrinum TaxID=3053191 RepID=UPI0028705843|nr:cilium assembly protein DZIP1-like [Stegostoma tigrinum]
MWVLCKDQDWHFPVRRNNKDGKACHLGKGRPKAYGTGQASRKKGREHAPIYVDGAEVEGMESINFLRLTITDNLSQLPLFQFKTRQETVNWRRISAIDVDRVAHELDFVTLQENILNITFCNMDTEKCPYCQNPLDPTLLKLFRLAQLTIEYLLHSQEYLTVNLQMYEEKLQASEFGKEQIKKELCNLSDEMKSQKEECKCRKQIISSQQMMIQPGANNYYKCQYCDKTFMNSFYMQSHIQRRHPNNATSEKQKKNESVKIQDEIDQLKKQLQHIQSQLETEKQLYFKTHSQELEKRRMEENETIKSFERWKEEEKKKLNSEMEKMKEMLAEEFREMTEKNTALERVKTATELVHNILKVAYVSEHLGRNLVECFVEADIDNFYCSDFICLLCHLELLQVKSTSMQLKSSLGALKNEHEHNIQEESRRYQQEVKDLKNILEKQENKWTSDINSLLERHDHEKQKLQLEIESLMSSITKNQKANSCYCKKKMKELYQKLHDQHQLIVHQKEELKTCSVKLPGKKLEPSYMKHLPEVSTCNEDLRKVLKKNPNIVKELRKIVEKSLTEKLENLGIKPIWQMDGPVKTQSCLLKFTSAPSFDDVTRKVDEDRAKDVVYEMTAHDSTGRSQTGGGVSNIKLPHPYEQRILFQEKTGIDPAEV